MERIIEISNETSPKKVTQVDLDEVMRKFSIDFTPKKASTPVVESIRVEQISDTNAEQARLAEQKRLDEQKRLAEQARISDELRLAEQARIAEEAKLAELAKRRQEEENRLYELRKKQEEEQLKLLELQRKQAEELRKRELDIKAAEEALMKARESELIRKEQEIKRREAEQRAAEQRAAEQRKLEKIEQLKRLNRLKKLKEMQDKAKDTKEKESNKQAVSGTSDKSLYDSLDVESLYNKVKKYIEERGLSRQLVSRDILDKKFGKNNINKLILKSYLVNIPGKGVTFGNA